MQYFLIIIVFVTNRGLLVIPSFLRKVSSTVSLLLLGRTKFDLCLASLSCCPSESKGREIKVAGTVHLPV